MPDMDVSVIHSKGTIFQTGTDSLLAGSLIEVMFNWARSVLQTMQKAYTLATTISFLVGGKAIVGLD